MRLESLEHGAEIDLICRKRCKAARSSKPQYRTNAMGPSDHADSRARPSMGPAMDPYNSVGWVAWLASPSSLEPAKTSVTHDRMLVARSIRMDGRQKGPHTGLELESLGYSVSRAGEEVQNSRPENSLFSRGRTAGFHRLRYARLFNRP